MYLPSHFSETDLAVLHALMQANPLASLVTLTSDGVNADHIPLLLAPAEGACGVLRGHVARSNPVWQRTLPQSDVLAIFQGIDQYISPTWYPTKHEHGKAVPTWNYAVVHATGVASRHRTVGPHHTLEFGQGLQAGFTRVFVFGDNHRITLLLRNRDRGDFTVKKA